MSNPGENCDEDGYSSEDEKKLPPCEQDEINYEESDW